MAADSSNVSPQQQHALWLKIARTMKPGLMTAPVSMGEEWEPIGRVLEVEYNKDIRATPSLPGIPLSDKLELHQTQNESSKPDQIYLGESYRVYVSVGNEVTTPVTDIVLKVEVITASRNRLQLHQSTPLNKMPPGGRMDNIFSYDVKDMGEHSIICTVSYVMANGDQKLLRKIQNFIVNKPLEVRPDFQVLENDILFSVQIQNAMSTPVFLETVQFEPVAGFTSQDLTITSDGSSVFGKDLFHPRASRQYLYRLTPKVSQRTIVSKSVSVGKMDIIWRGRFGERGRIQTGSLKATLPPLPELQVSLVKSPGKVVLEKSFQITLTVTNNTDRKMLLHYTLDDRIGTGLIWCGTTKDTSHELNPSSTLNIVLSLLPVIPGLQPIGLITFVNILDNQKKYPIAKLGHVYVLRNTGIQQQDQLLGGINTHDSSNNLLQIATLT